MALTWKKGYFWPTFHIFLSPGKSHKTSFNTYLTHIHTRILLTLLTFFTLPILKKIRIYQVRFLFGMILIRAILEQSINNKMVSKI